MAIGLLVAAWILFVAGLLARTRRDNGEVSSFSRWALSLVIWWMGALLTLSGDPGSTTTAVMMIPAVSDGEASVNLATAVNQHPDGCVLRSTSRQRRALAHEHHGESS